MSDDVTSASTRLAPCAAVWLLAPILVLNIAIGIVEVSYPAPLFNDGLLHLHQVERMDLAWERGESIIDHWDETLGLGYPFTRTYAYFSHLTIWGLHRALGDGVALPAIYTFLVSLAWFLWPLSLYRGLLLLEAKPLVAVGAAWMASLAHTEFRFGIDLETFGWLGYGFLPNLMALVVMPLALGYGWQFIKNGKAFLLATLAFIVVTGCHLVMGYVVGVTGFLGVAVLYWKHRSRHLPMRLGLLLLASGLALLFLVVPYIRDSPFINRTALEHPHYWDSVGLVGAVRSLLTGKLVDFHVLVPVITLLAGVGTFKAATGGRWARGAVFVGGFWFLAFAGRGWWNPLTYALPFSASIPFERFLIPLQMCLFVLAGLGLDALCQWTKVKSIIKIGMVLTLLFCLHLGKNIDQGLVKSMQAKRRVVAAETEIGQVLEQIAHLDQVGNGERLLVTADPQVKIGGVPLYALPLMADLPHVGFLWHSMSLNAEFLSGVDLDAPPVRDLFAVRYVLQEIGLPDTPSSQAIWHNDRFELRFIPQNALFCAGRLSRSLNGTARENADEIRHWMQSSQPLNGDFLGLNTTINGSDERSMNQVLGYGRVTDNEFGYDSKVHFASAGHLIAKISFHPQWQAWVDGVETAIQPVAPSLMAVPIEPGQHMVRFRYRPSGSTKWLLIFGLVQLAVITKLSRSKYFRSNAKK